MSGKVILCEVLCRNVPGRTNKSY